MRGLRGDPTSTGNRFSITRLISLLPGIKPVVVALFNPLSVLNVGISRKLSLLAIVGFRPTISLAIESFFLVCVLITKVSRLTWALKDFHVVLIKFVLWPGCYARYDRLGLGEIHFDNWLLS